MTKASPTTVLLRVLEASVDEKAEALLRAVASIHGQVKRDGALQRIVFEREAHTFSAVPRSPFAYWVSEGVRGTFARFSPISSKSIATVGLQSSDDFRFLRLSWERSKVSGFTPFAKGGAASRHYADIYLSVGWASDGREIKTFAESTPGSSHWSRNIRSAEHYFRPGLTWPLRTNGLSFRAMPAGCIFGHKGPAAFVNGDSPDQLLALLAITTSAAFCYLVELQMAFGSYEVGVIQRTPVPDPSDSDVVALARLAHRAWSLKRLLDTTNETSHAFVLPPGTLGYEASPFHPEAGGFNRAGIQRELAEIQAKIDDKVFALYGISDEDRATIEASMTRGAGISSDGDGTDTDSSDDAEQFARQRGRSHHRAHRHNAHHLLLARWCRLRALRSASHNESRQGLQNRRWAALHAHRGRRS